MRTLRLLGVLLVSVLAGESAFCDEVALPEKVISEQAMRSAAARLYSDILFRACINGHRYSRSQIEKGFKRHAGEMKLHLETQGFRIVSGTTTPSSNSLGMAVVAKSKPAERRFGCLRPYWLDDRISTAVGDAQ